MKTIIEKLRALPTLRNDNKVVIRTGLPLSPKTLAIVCVKGKQISEPVRYQMAKHGWTVYSMFRVIKHFTYHNRIMNWAGTKYKVSCRAIYEHHFMPELYGRAVRITNEDRSFDSDN